MINRPYIEKEVINGEIHMCEKILNPENITNEEMKEIANGIEDYLYEFEPCMIIPKDMYEHDKNRILDGLKLVKKLIKNLRKCDRDKVFKKSWEYD